jgi:hypothetical protein
MMTGEPDPPAIERIVMAPSTRMVADRQFYQTVMTGHDCQMWQIAAAKYWKMVRQNGGCP